MEAEAGRVAEELRAALVRAALAAYEDAGIRGLCPEGAWEAAVAAMRQLDLRQLDLRQLDLRQVQATPSEPDAVTIRGAEPADARRIAALSGVLGYPVSVEAIAERLGRLLFAPGDVVLVAELGGRVVGWLHGAEQELLESGRRCEILGLVVDPECRGRGVGRRLVTAVEGWAAGRGLEQVAVRSNVTRVESHPFYERLGYVRAKTQHAYRKRIPVRDAG